MSFFAFQIFRHCLEVISVTAGTINVQEPRSAILVSEFSGIPAFNAVYLLTGSPLCGENLRADWRFFTASDGLTESWCSYITLGPDYKVWLSLAAAVLILQEGKSLVERNSRFQNTFRLPCHRGQNIVIQQIEY
ncbi:MAG: hypothetical protein V1794_00740 [Candidatus Glassbacteria bacterium]